MINVFKHVRTLAYKSMHKLRAKLESVRGLNNLRTGQSLVLALQLQRPWLEHRYRHHNSNAIVLLPAYIWYYMSEFVHKFADTVDTAFYNELRVSRVCPVRLEM